MGKPSTTPPSIQKKSVRIPTVDAEATSNPAGPWYSGSVINVPLKHYLNNYHYFEPPEKSVYDVYLKKTKDPKRDI